MNLDDDAGGTDHGHVHGPHGHDHDDRHDDGHVDKNVEDVAASSSTVSDAGDELHHEDDSTGDATAGTSKSAAGKLKFMQVLEN